MPKRNLLLVDADPRSLRVLEVSLRKAGYSVTASTNVDAALELIDLAEPDMVIADTRLPGRDGFELVSELRRRSSTQHLPIMLLSSDPSVGSKMRGLELGIEDYLAKPVYIHEILARVRLTMERREREGLGRTAKTRFAGSLQDMGLVDLLQTIEVSRKSGVLKLASGARRGLVYFQEGRVIDAELGALSGEAAIYRFLIWSEGTFELEFGEVQREDRLGISTQALLMEGVRRLDEWGRLQEQLPSLDTVLEVDHGELAARIGEIPDELNGVLRAFDGTRDLADVLEVAEGDDLAVLTAVSRLYFDGFLKVRHRSEPSRDAQVGTHSDPFLGYVPVDSLAPASAETEPRTPSRPGVSAFSQGESDPGRAPTVSSRTIPEEVLQAAPGRVPLAVVQLKRVSAIGELGPSRASLVAREIGPDSTIAQGDPEESSRSTSDLESDDDMKRRGKRRAERAEERGGGTVIPLHQPRADASTVQERDASGSSQERESTVPRERESQETLTATHDPIAVPAGELSQREPTHEEQQEVHAFFSRPSHVPHSAEPWSDLDGEHDHEPDSPVQGSHKRGMQWTAAIAAAGLLLIGAFLLYHKVLMPTPEELGPSSTVALPTPDMMRDVPQLPPGKTSTPEPSPTEANLNLAPPPAAAGDEPPPSETGEPAPPADAPAAALEPPTGPAGAFAAVPPAAVEPAAPVGKAPAQANPAYDQALAEARKLGFRKGAEERYLAAVAANPAGTDALSGLAMLYLNQGKNQDAKQRAEQALAIDPASAEGWIVLGAAESALGRPKEARAAYTRCAALPGKYASECKRLL